MKLGKLFVVCLLFCLSGCAQLQRLTHVYSNSAPLAHSFQYGDGGTSLYYAFAIKEGQASETMIFFYGGSGCASWKSVMPAYVEGLSTPARIFVLNKRFVGDRSIGMFACSEDFHQANNPDQWLADYSEFIKAQLGAAAVKPRNVVMVGVSEGGLIGAMLAGRLPQVTHLAIVGGGAYSMRQSLRALKRRGAIVFDVDAGWEKIARDPRSTEKTWYGAPYRWWSDIMDIDPLPYFLKLAIPILVGIGEEDQSVPVESVRHLAEQFKEAGKSNLTLKVYPGADHRLNVGGISLRERYFSTLSQWLESSGKLH